MVKDALQTYRRKRNFSRTPEPSGARELSRARPRRKANTLSGAYVIQKHAARALHYDLRLEVDGVFKSWAVPKGLSLRPGERHLAVQVEDHPFEYGSFEGVIPKGEYGGGTVMLWDRGRWSSPSTRADLDNGKLEIELDGEKLSGRWLLVRMSGRGEQPNKNWLLIKRGAAIEAPPSDSSVATGRTMREIARAGDRTWTRDGESRPKPSERGAPKARLDRAVRKPLPDIVKPQLATLVDAAPDGDAWVHEIKLDGYRLLARIDNGKCRLISRNGKNWTARFPEIAAQLATLPARQVLLDGEVVAIASNGATSFHALQRALSEERTDPLVYYAFDLLHLDGYSLMDSPLIERKEALHALLDAAGFGGDGRVRYAEHLDTSGPRFFEEACKLGLEGIVSKRRDAPYRAGRGRTWLKTKCAQHDELVIGGYTEPAGTRTGLGALLLGAYDADGRLRYVGKVGTGFDTRMLSSLAAKLAKIETTQSPFANAPRQRGVHWVKPSLVAEVAFTERTRDGMLRHPTFRGIREDKGPKEVKLPSAKNANAKTAKAWTGKKSAGRRAPNHVEVAGVRLTNPDRVLWPERGITKLKLASYYKAIEPWLMPMLRDRPLALLRCPEGRAGECFFQKHPGETMSEAIPRIDIREKSGTTTYMYATSIADVIRLVQMGVLELHVWGSRVDDLEHPDIIVIDLDPGPDVAWRDVIGAAVRVRDILGELGFASFPRLTGGKGLHVVVPLEPAADWDTVKAFSLAVAQRAAKEEPERYTTNMAKSKRSGRIFIDYLRNGRGATAIASYSSRAREGAPVAVPLRWEELDKTTGSDRFDVLNLRRRLSGLRADPWADFDAARRPLAKGKRR